MNENEIENKDAESLDLTEKNSSAENPEITPFENADGILQLLSYLSNSGYYGFGITLFVGGMLISGNVISNKEFRQNLTDTIRGNFEKNSDDEKAFIENYLQYIAPQDEEKENLTQPIETRYIHLRNAKIFNAGNKPIPFVDGFIWRGRLESIDGFSFGRLAYEEPVNK
jgi:hypothetical protein